MFALFKGKREKVDAAGGLYEAVVAQSRLPVFYELYGVPDTVDGRFDLICLHTYLVMDRLFEDKRKGKRLAQAVFDRMFRNMDHVLREMGVGDLAIPHHMKRMMKGFNGRAVAYQDAMRAEEPEELEDVLRRNLYGTAEKPPGDETVKVMAPYMHETALTLEDQPWEQLAAGIIELKRMDYEEENGNGRKNTSGMVA